MLSKGETHSNEKTALKKQSPQPTAQNLDTLTQQQHSSVIIQRAMLNPNSLSTGDMLQLQRTIGNRAVQRILTQIAKPQPEFRTTSPHSIQTKLTVGPVGDIYEQEADRVAKQVMSISANPPQPVLRQTEEEQEKIQMMQTTGSIPPLTQRAPEEEEEMRMAPLMQQQAEDKKLQALSSENIQRVGLEGGDIGPDLESSIHSVRGSGQFLDGGVQTRMEGAFGADFSRVRVHTDVQSDRLNRLFSARAFTSEQDIFFRSGEYEPGSRRGQELIAHELTHVVQQGGGQHPGRINRAVDFNIGDAEVHADYSARSSDNDNVNKQNLTKTVGQITERVTKNFLLIEIDDMTESQRKWAVYGLVLLSNNKDKAPGLDLKQALIDIIFHAKKAATTPVDNPAPPYPFESEVLRISGWLEKALLKNLSAPLLNITDELYNPPIPLSKPVVLGEKPVTLPLDESILNTELPLALENYIISTSPDPSTQPKQSVDSLKIVSDAVYTVAREFFAPYVGATKKDIVPAGWQYSSSIHSTTDQTITQNTRYSLLRNRAQLVGNSGGGGSIFSRAHFDISNTTHAQKLEIIIQYLEGKLRQRIDWHIQQIGRTSPGEHAVYMPPVHRMSTDGQARWSAIDTLTHELLHALAHPDFTAKASNIRHAAIIQEGFTEMLGVDLYNEVAARAAKNQVFRKTMHTGIGDFNIPPLPHQATVDYGKAGEDAVEIRRRMGPNGKKEVLAAYFLGAVHLIGL